MMREFSSSSYHRRGLYQVGTRVNRIQKDKNGISVFTHVKLQRNEIEHYLTNEQNFRKIALLWTLMGRKP